MTTEEPKNRQGMRSNMKAAVAVVAVVILVVIVSVGGYLGGWWLKEDSVNRRAEISNDSYNRQTALVESILDDIKEAEGNIPPAQRVAIVDQICDNAAQLSGRVSLSSNAQQFINQECN